MAIQAWGKSCDQTKVCIVIPPITVLSLFAHCLGFIPIDYKWIYQRLSTAKVSNKVISYKSTRIDLILLYRYYLILTVFWQHNFCNLLHKCRSIEVSLRMKFLLGIWLAFTLLKSTVGIGKLELYLYWCFCGLDSYSITLWL